MPDNSNKIQESTNISSKKIREPRQKRSIEKKNKIIKAGMELILENGYHSTTTADIAKKAGVSTGIVYSYFEDKKHILLSGLTDYIIMTQNPTFDFLKDYHQPEDWDILLKELIDHFVEMHKVFFKSHQELNALATLDADVRALFEEFEEKMINECVTLFSAHVGPVPHLHEKFHIVYHLIEDYCHGVVISPNPNFDYDALKAEVISCVKHLLLLSPR